VTTPNLPEKFDSWAIVELMGHQRIAGRVTEQAVFGTSLMRIDVPDTPKKSGFTKFYGSSAIYAITPVDEQTARAAAAYIDVEPIREYEIAQGQRRLLAAAQTLEDADSSGNGVPDDDDDYSHHGDNLHEAYQHDDEDNDEDWF
jgi:hypothetical protein